MASVVRPEVKLKAILEITRNLSSELKIDAVAPKILDSLMELFPQAERLFLMLQRPGDQTPGPQGVQAPARAGGRPSAGAPDDEPPMSISRSLVNHVLGQKKAVLSQDAGNDKNLPTSASIADLKIRSVMCAPLLTPDGEASGSSSSTRATASSSSRKTSTCWRPSPARPPSPSRTRRCTRRSWPASGSSAT